MKEGGSSRKDLIGKMLADMGGSLEAFYFAFGEDDVVVIADLPDNATAAAVGMAVGAAGGARDEDHGPAHARGDRRGEPQDGRRTGRPGQ